MDSTDTTCVACAALNVNVPIQTPCLTPRVLDNPIVLPILRPITDRQHSMVNVIWTIRAGSAENTLGVELEILGSGVDSHTDRLLGNCTHEGSLIVGLDVLIAINGDSFLVFPEPFAELRSTLATRIWIPTFGVDATVLHHPFEGWIHKATVTAIIAMGAAHEFLFGKAKELSSSDGMGTLDRPNSGKSPTTTAMPLVFHRCHGSLFSPIYRLGQAIVAAGCGQVLSQHPIAGNIRAEAEVLGLEFFQSKICKVVEAELMGVRPLVMLMNIEEVVLEDMEASVFMGGAIRSGVILGMVKDPAIEKGQDTGF